MAKKPNHFLGAAVANDLTIERVFDDIGGSKIKIRAIPSRWSTRFVMYGVQGGQYVELASFPSQEAVLKFVRRLDKFRALFRA